MSFIALIILTLGVACGCMLAMWLVSLMIRDASVVDPFWGTGFAIVVWTSVWALSTFPKAGSISMHYSGWLTAILVTLWGLRLSGFLALRNFGKEEDRRYEEMRKKHGDRFWWVSLLTVFLLQALVMWIVSIPVQFVLFASVQGESEVTLAVLLAGSLVWLIGFFFESVGDWQMSRFQSDASNEGKVMDQGLWSYTRHPNYFGDFCVWWGLYLIATSCGGWWTIFSPLIMSFLLLRVSGVTLLEKEISQRRPGYEAYVKRTNAFFPGMPRD